MYYFYLLKLYLKYYQLFSLVFKTDQMVDENDKESYRCVEPGTVTKDCCR